MGFYVDGQSYPSQPLRPNYEANQYIDSYSEEEEAEEEEEEEGRRGKMFTEEEQNWIKKNVLWRREEVEEGNI